MRHLHRPITSAFVVLIVAIGLSCTNAVAGGSPCSEFIAESDSLRKAGQYKLALQVAMRSLECVVSEFGPEDTLTAKVLYRIGVIQASTGQLDSAISEFQRCLSIFEAKLRADDAAVGSVCNALGAVLKDKSRYRDAEQYLRRALAIKGKAPGEHSGAYANSLCTLADLLVLEDEFTEGEALLKKAIDIRRDELGPDDPKYASAVTQLAALYHREGKFVLARALYDRALRIHRQSLAPDHSEMAETLSLLASLLDDQGLFEEAKDLHMEAVAIWDSLGSPSIHVGLLNLARNRQKAGELDQALLYVARARESVAEHYGPGHWRMARVYNQAGAIYGDLGDHHQAEKLFRQAVQIAREQLGDHHTDVGLALNNLATQLTALGEYNEAERVLRQSLSTFLGQEVANPLRVGLVLESLAELDMARLEFGETVGLVDSAIQIMSPASQTFNESIIRCLNLKTQALLGLDKTETARVLADSAVFLAQLLLGKENLLTALCFESRALVAWVQGNSTEAVNAARDAYKTLQGIMVNTLPLLTERQALTYAARLRELGHLYVRYALAAGNVAEDADVAEAVLACKGIVTDAVSYRVRGGGWAEGAVTVRLREQLESVMTQISDVVFGGLDAGQSGCHEDGRLDSLIAVADSLDEQIALTRIATETAPAIQVDADSISDRLPASSVLVDYIYLRGTGKVSDTSDGRYAVLVCSQELRPTVIDLGDAGRIESAMACYRAHFNEFIPGVSSDVTYRAIASSLYDLIWRPIATYVEGRDLVLVAMDGSLEMLSIAGLVDSDGSYLIEEHTIHYLSSGRDLARVVKETPGNKGLLVICDPDVSVTPSVRSTSSEPRFSSIEDLGPLTERSGIQDLQPIGNLFLPRLPWARSEANAVAGAWRSKRVGEAIVLCGAEATESALKQLAYGKAAIHIAAHGYLIEETKPPAVAHGGFADESLEMNPLLRSGLLLTKSVGPSAENGILTAQEVLGLDLQGTELVVLSACLTGLGQVAAGEGVYGLRRAFQLAGARTVVCALWAVSDVSASQLMSDFYTKWGHSVPEALRSVQLQEIRRLRSAQQSDHPYYWAGFISIGGLE